MSRTDLHECNALLGLLVEDGDALLEAFLVGLPGLQQLCLAGAVCLLQSSWHLHVLKQAYNILESSGLGYRPRSAG